VHALLAVESLARTIWEPACGPGSIVHVLRAAGHAVYATDLVDYGCPQSESGIDFLKTTVALAETVVTNPPYKRANQFVAHALQLCPRVVMLLRLAFLEGQRRSTILEDGGLARVNVFKNRLPMMHCAGWNGPRATSSIPFAWFVFERGYCGPPELHRIAWK
jgi:hypothetical protein